MIGQTLSHYRILGALGAGGMGVVYQAEDERLGRQVALKLLPADAVKNPQALDRFGLEARTASALSHPGICAIHDIGVHDGAPFIVMELLRGETLRERVARGPMKIADVLDVGIQLADALGAAHAQGIVHRDIKPGNIFIGDKLRVKILDFGLAKFAREHPRLDSAAAANVTAPAHPLRYDNQLTTPGTAIGTVSYMSPEQARGEDVDSRTDIFSLGVVLYEMVTGRQAFVGSTSAVVFDAILNRAPMSPVVLNPDTPPRLHEAINTALEKDRDLRYQHAADLEADLKRIRRDLQSGQTLSARHTAAVAAPTASPNALTTTTPPASAPITAAQSGATSGAVTVGTGTPWTAVAIVVAALIGAAVWMTRPVPADPPAAAASGDAEAQRARVRFDARDYRAALAEADAALARDPGNAEAARIKADAEARLTDLDRLLVEATAALDAGDGVTASARLARAQELAPGDARVAEVLARLRTLPAAPTVRAAESRSLPPVAPRAEPAPTTPRAADRTPSLPRPVDAPVPEPLPPPPGERPAAAPERPAPAVEFTPAAPAPAPAPIAPTTPPPTPAPAAVAPAGPLPALPARESDDAVIRRVIGSYERAIETKDLALFRSVRPGLSADEERRLRASFDQVDAQQVEIRIESIAVTGDTAVARLARQDTVERGGRTQTSRSTQTVRLARRGTTWVIVELAR